MELAANSLGLGALYSGFFTACVRLGKKLRALLRLPKCHEAVSCLVIGCTSIKYRRVPPRKPAGEAALSPQALGLPRHGERLAPGAMPHQPARLLAPLKAISAGRTITPNLSAKPGSSPTLTLRTLKAGLSAAISSIAGSSISQKPHHGAQKSTSAEPSKRATRLAPAACLAPASKLQVLSSQF